MSKSTTRWIRDLSIGALLLTGVAACTWQGIKPDDSGPRRLYISGHSAHVSDGELARLAAPYLKASFFDVDLKGLQDKLAAKPWLTDVSVSRHWPNGVVVHIADRKPVAYWGNDRMLGADGEIFAPDKRPPGLVQLDGADDQAAKVYAQYRRLSGILAGHGAHLASLKLDADGDWQGRLDNGLALRLGHDELAARMQRFVRFGLERSAASSALAEAGYVDLRYSDGFAVGGTRKQVASASGQENMG
ncbi:cell division protein FtsQ/DivIB [Salinisphaera sp. Q1T1-3]|uniref:cell division protein FtsQ/DivIB n=1 Tax=Salinisphaera sp. Q1T1-3 TaxID=2321229 RepID=UPI000E741B52|nr:cell division protein FtsQ/DivIB [Salinisphaera sp. Q1T1-3]RJS92222.1 FtsQ-type POTRA domain-containing protein [Salinisphaera sp. Q1T1-3]